MILMVFMVFSVSGTYCQAIRYFLPRHAGQMRLRKEGRVAPERVLPILLLGLEGTFKQNVENISGVIHFGVIGGRKTKVILLAFHLAGRDVHGPLKDSHFAELEPSVLLF